MYIYQKYYNLKKSLNQEEFNKIFSYVKTNLKIRIKTLFIIHEKEYGI